MVDNPGLGCKGCELAAGCKTPHMEPDLRGLVTEGKCDVLIIGEAPGAEEDKLGRPFVGPSGSVLRTIVEDVGLDAYQVAYTNVVRCRPPENKTPDAKQIKACTPTLLQEIADLDPKLVLLLGNVPLKAVMGETGITAWRGAKMERDGRTYLPTFHPAYILRNNAELPTLVGDIQLAYDIISGADAGSLLDEYEVTLVASAEDARQMHAAILRAGTVAWDTESRNAKPYAEGARMLMLSFAVDNPSKQAWSVIPGDDRVDRVCRAILKNPKLRVIGHNVKYDQHVVWSEWGIEVPGVIGDSMLASWLLDPTPGRHGLKHLAGRLLGLYEYNAELDAYHAANPKSNPANEGGDQALVPLEILAPYAAIDAIATLEVHKLLYGQMSQVQKVLYDQLLMQSSNALYVLERNGAPIDTYIANRYIKVYGAIQQQQFDAMLANPIVMKFSQRRQAMLDAAFDAKYAGKKTRAKRPVFSFNPNSDIQMRELLFSSRYMGLPADGKTEKGDKSTKWEFLKPYANDNPFLQAYHYWSLMDKALSTYLKPAVARWPSADGRVRSTYKVHGTVSGRLASAEPNLQNIPTPEKEPNTVLATLPVKNIFTASDWAAMYPKQWQTWLDSITPEERAYWEDLLGPYFDKGGMVMAADYSGMELRTIASLAGCQRMLDIFERGEDVHRIVSAGIFNVPVEDVTKEMRYRGKWTNWTLLYGGSEHTFLRLYGIPLEEGKRFIKVYYGLFPEIKQFHEYILQSTRELGYVESAFGFRRYMPYINDNTKKNASLRASNERETLNHPIQSAASHILMMALVIVNDVLRMNDMQSRLINTVHDQVMLDTPLWEAKVAGLLVKRVMEGLKDVYKSWFPGMDLSWFTCPLVVDLEAGSHYGSMVEFHVDQEAGV